MNPTDTIDKTLEPLPDSMLATGVNDIVITPNAIPSREEKRQDGFKLFQLGMIYANALSCQGEDYHFSVDEVHSFKDTYLKAKRVFQMKYPETFMQKQVARAGQLLYNIVALV